MSQTIVSVKMYDDLKQEFESVCNELGFSITTAVTILAKKMTREKRLPFEVSLDPFYSYSNMQAIGESIEQMKQGKTVSKTLEELEMMEHG